MKKTYCDLCEKEIRKEEKIWRIIISPMINRGRGPIPTLFPSQEYLDSDKCRNPVGLFVRPDPIIDASHKEK